VGEDLQDIERATKSDIDGFFVSLILVELFLVGNSHFLLFPLSSSVLAQGYL
jgi:hypothetical protein